MSSRTCDGCAKCCEGWLHGDAYGHAFYPGRPCFFLNKTCSIYDTRPEDPCRTFKCAWVDADIFPAWMKPDLVNAIIVRRVHNNIKYYEVSEAGGTLDSKTLSWLVQWALNNKENLSYSISGGRNKIGSKEFLEMN